MSAVNSLAGISQTEFLQLLVSQLKNQDPLNPMSDTDFATQLAALSEVGSLDALQTTSTSQLQAQQLSSGAALIGQTVSYTTADSTTASEGTVSGMTIQSGAVDLTINGTNVPLTSINSIN